MIVKNKFFTFELVQLHNLEVLRQMRNSEFLEEYMHTKSKISKHQQLNWYNNLDKKNNLYFIAKKESKIIGYTMIKGINYKKLEGEPGTFLIEKNMFESSEAALFMMSFLDYCYFKLDIKFFYGNVLKSNKRALSNYSFFDKKEILENEKCFILKSKSKESYLENTQQIRKSLKILFGYTNKFEIRY